MIARDYLAPVIRRPRASPVVQRAPKQNVNSPREELGRLLEACSILRLIVLLREHFTGLGRTELDRLHHGAASWLAHFEALADEAAREGE